MITPWFLDSGATHHVTDDGDSLPTKTEYSSIAKLAIGNGSTLPISHIDTVKIPASKPLILKNILLVPAITKNLISISKFTLENNVIVELLAHNPLKKKKLDWSLKKNLIDRKKSDVFFFSTSEQVIQVIKWIVKSGYRTHGD